MSDSDGVACRLEPPSLVEAFVKHPPHQFSAFFIGQNWVSDKEKSGTKSKSDSLTRSLLNAQPIPLTADFDEDLKTGQTAGERPAIPAFSALFDLTTTLDIPALWLRTAIARVPLFRGLLRLPTLFVGSTVSEFCLLPREADFQAFSRKLTSDMGENGFSLIIVKDIAASSEILDREANQLAQHCLDKLIESDFITVEGQALAYVPINFASEDEYLKRFSRSRRKDLRRKLKTRAELEIKEIPTGDPIFFDDQFLNQFYELYLNVYDQSEIHFDRLSLSFFKQVLQDGNCDGVCFVYLQADRMIGWNLCFVYDNRLIDKYIGLVYPDARRLNLYFVSWFHNLRFAIEKKLDYYVAGWTDREVKEYLGASFTFTRHAVYFANPVLRMVLKPLKRFFESDSNRAGRNRTESCKAGHGPSSEVAGRNAGQAATRDSARRNAEHDPTLDNAANRDGGQNR